MQGLDPDSSSGSFTSDMDLDVYAERELQREVNSRAAGEGPETAGPCCGACRGQRILGTQHSGNLVAER